MLQYEKFDTVKMKRTQSPIKKDGALLDNKTMRKYSFVSTVRLLCPRAPVNAERRFCLNIFLAKYFTALHSRVCTRAVFHRCHFAFARSHQRNALIVVGLIMPTSLRFLLSPQKIPRKREKKNWHDIVAMLQLQLYIDDGASDFRKIDGILIVIMIIRSNLQSSSLPSVGSTFLPHSSLNTRVQISARVYSYQPVKYIHTCHKISLILFQRLSEIA